MLVASFWLKGRCLARRNALLGDIISAGHSNPFASRGHAKLEVVVTRPSGFYSILDGVEDTFTNGTLSSVRQRLEWSEIFGSPCAQEERGLANSLARMDCEWVGGILE